LLPLFRMTRSFRRLGASVIALFLLAAACSGRSVSDPNQTERNGTAGRGGQGATGGAGGGSGAVGGTGAVGGFCFEAGSRVATPGGSVAIEDLRVGDEVLAFDERTAAIAPRRVLTTHVHETTRTGVLTLRDGRTIRVTPEHPIFDAGTQRFEPAGSLEPGDVLVTLPLTLGSFTSGVRPADVAPSLLAPVTTYEPRELDTPVSVYNLSVEAFETYFVEGVLVHNKSTGGSGGTGGFGGTGGYTGGVSGGGGTAGACERLRVEAFLDEPCAEVGPCLDPLAPSDDFVTLNRAVPTPENEGAGGEGGAGGEAGQTGGGDDSVGFTEGLARVCNPPEGGYPPDASYFLAFDAFQPQSGVAAHELVSSNGGCWGTVIGDVVLADFAAPLRGTWTTQCVRLSGSELAFGVILTTAESARFANPRFVTGCECPRHLKRYTTCGYDPNGQGLGSACEP
jgi:hypothetical protein